MSNNSKIEVFRHEAVASTSAHYTYKPIAPQVSCPDSLMSESNHPVSNVASASMKSDSDTHIVCDVSPDIVSYIVSSKTPHKVPKNITSGTRKPFKKRAKKNNKLSVLIQNIFKYLRKNPKKSLTSDSSEAVAMRQDESEPVMACDLSPGTSSINTSSISYKTPQKLSKMRKSTTMEVPNNNGPGKSKKIRNNVQFILHTIDQYVLSMDCSDGHLNTLGAFEAILEDESLSLLSTWPLLTEPAKGIVCYFYCIDHEKHIEGISSNIETLDIEDIEMSLSETGFITLCSKAYLKSKIRKMWKLSDHARETINELLILMHLDNIFNMGCSIDPTDRKNNRPAIKFKPPVITKCYPVDKEMIVDNTSIVFQDRNEFCRYLEAYAFFEKYETAQNKCEIALDALKFYKQVTEESLLRYSTLPLWLRKFTPAYLFVKILEDSVSYLKMSEQYKKAVHILDTLISQVTFRQHMKAEWYDMKIEIQLYRLKSVNKAACTLRNAYAADLPKEAKYNMRRRAKQIIYRHGLNEEHYSALEAQGKKATIENSISKPDYFYQQPLPCRDKGFKYQWNNEIVSAEIFCYNIYKQMGGVTIGGHWHGKVVTTIYFLLFWDIIYTKPLGVTGIFMSHYQLYPLDMWCESFYINRKAKIDKFLTDIEKSTSDEIIEIMRERWNDPVKYDVPDIVRTADCDKQWINITTVVHCLGSQALAAICRRLARNYEYARNGFPDLTLCGTNSIKFREVKTVDKARPNQMHWLMYLQENNIDASICYLRKNREEQSPESNHTTNSEEESMDID